MDERQTPAAEVDFDRRQHRKSGVSPISTIHLRAARMWGMRSSLSQIWKIQLARNSAGKLKAARRPDTAKNESVSGTESNPAV